MNTLARIKRRFTLVLAGLAAVDLILLVYLLWPGASPSAKLAQEENLQQQQTALCREVAPLKDIDQKLTQTRGDVQRFYEQKVPTEFSQISQHLEKLVQETGVSTQGIHYSEEKTEQAKNDLPDVQRIGIDTTVTGDYAKIARFINALEQDKFVFIINQITLSSSEGSNVVSLQIKFETFLKQPA
jgi:Tfp pilus assembly protein PilO